VTFEGFMPRKEKQQPLPFETFVLCDGTIVEIRGPGHNEIYPGSNMIDAHVELCIKIVDHLITEFKYVTADGIGELNMGPLANWQELDKEMQLCGKFPEIIDSGAVRKRIYPKVYKILEQYWLIKKRLLSIE
jgi:hypothetical protein